MNTSTSKTGSARKWVVYSSEFFLVLGVLLFVFTGAAGLRYTLGMYVPMIFIGVILLGSSILSAYLYTQRPRQPQFKYRLPLLIALSALVTLAGSIYLHVWEVANYSVYYYTFSLASLVLGTITIPLEQNK